MRLTYVLALLLIAHACADLPVFRFAGTVNADGSPIVGNIMCASPAPVDWDGDGLMDLLVGEFGENVYPSAATIRFFRNTASSANIVPVLKAQGPMSAGGSEIHLSAG